MQARPSFRDQLCAKIDNSIFKTIKIGPIYVYAYKCHYALHGHLQLTSKIVSYFKMLMELLLFNLVVLIICHELISMLKGNVTIYDMIYRKRLSFCWM